LRREREPAEHYNHNSSIDCHFRPPILHRSIVYDD
jgi:hypothetical protein